MIKTSLLFGFLFVVLCSGEMEAQRKILTRTTAGESSEATDTSWAVTYYYPKWAYGGWDQDYRLPPDSLDAYGVDYIVVFDNGNISTEQAPYHTYSKDPDLSDPFYSSYDDLLYGNWTWGGSFPNDTVFFLDTLIAVGHRQGAKMLLTMQAVDGTRLEWVTGDSARTDTLCNSFVAFAKSLGFDGIELDWEFWISGEPPSININRLVRRLRYWMDYHWPGGAAPLLVSAGRFQGDLYEVGTDQYVTGYILQLYDYDQVWSVPCASNNVWYLSPLVRGTIPSGYENTAWDYSGMKTWLSDGHDTSKVGGLMPSYGTVFKNVDSLFACQSSSQTSITKQDVWALTSKGGTLYHDTARGYAASIRGTANQAVTSPSLTNGQKFFATFEDSLSMYHKMVYYDTTGFRRVGFYDIYGDLDKTKPRYGGRHPTLDWIRQYLDRMP